MPDRYFSSRVRRLFREKGWTMATFERRTQIGRSILRRIVDTNGYCSVTQEQLGRLAGALNVTRDYLERGVGSPVGLISPSATQSQNEISRLRAELDALRRRRGMQVVNAGVSNVAHGALAVLNWASEEKLEVIYRDGKYVVMREHEYELSIGDTWLEALTIAFEGEDDSND